MVTIMEKHNKAIIEAVDKLPETFTWKMLSKKLNVLGYWISPKTVRRRLKNGVVDVKRIDIGLYRKNKVYYYENGDVVGQKPKQTTLEAIAEKTKRPLTISDVENTQHYKALEKQYEFFQESAKYRFDKLKEENESLKKELKMHKNLNWLKWLALTYGSLSGLYAIYHIVMEVLK